MEKEIQESRYNLIYLDLIQSFLSNQTSLNQELHSNLIDFLSFYKLKNSSNILKNLIHALLNSDAFLIDQIDSQDIGLSNQIQHSLYKLEFIHQVFYETYLNRSKTSECCHQSHLNQFIDQSTSHNHPLHHLNQSLIDLAIHTGIYNAIITSKTKPGFVLIRFIDRLETLLNTFDNFNQIEECSIIWVISKVFPLISIKDLNQISPTNQTKLVKILSSKIEEIIITKDSNEHQHPLYKTLGPISISFGSLLRSIGLQNNLNPILSSLNSLNDQLSNLNLSEALSSSKSMMFSVLGILIGPVYLKSNHEFLMVCLKLWSRIFHLIQNFGKSQFDGLVWDGIIDGIKALNDDEFQKLIRWLDPWKSTENGNHSGLLVYLSVLENCMERVDVSYLEENVVDQLWKEVESRGDGDINNGKDDTKFQSAWEVLISIVKHRKLREDDDQIIKFVDRMMDLVLSNETNQTHSKNDQTNEILKKETLKVMIQTINEEINWNHIIKRFQTENQYENLIEILKFTENQDEFIKVCQLLNDLVFEIQDTEVKQRVVMDWFEVVSQVGWVGPVKWWIHQFGGINGKGLAKL